MQAFEEFYCAMMPVVRGFIVSIDRRLCPHECDDLTHEVFMALWRRLDSYCGDASAKTFTLAIARNLTLKHLSEQRKQPTVCMSEDMTYIPGEESPNKHGLDTDEISLAIEEAMKKLTEPQRQAIELVWIQGMPRTEALKQAKCSSNQFASRLRRAVKTLRQALGGQSIRP